jgi:hypothetical protein
MSIDWDRELAERIRLAVAGGYDRAEQIVADLVELLEYDPEADDFVAGLGVPLVDHVTDLVTAARNDHRAREATFPAVTDCDRITAVLAALAASGIVTGEDVGMTLADVRYDLGEALRVARDRGERARDRGERARGWVGFHRQDVDRVVDTGVLCLAFGAPTDHDDAYRAIGREVAAAFAGAGLQVHWDDDPNRRIELHALTWQRRRPTGG